MIITRFSSLLLGLALSTGLLFSFQNCAPVGTKAKFEVVDAECNNAGGCAPAASQDETIDQASQVQQPAPVPAPSPSATPVFGPAVPPPPTQTTVLMYNFVAGDKATCEQSVLNRLGQSVTCTIGGGCGVSCGMPDGGNCVSANPSLYGACIMN